MYALRFASESAGSQAVEAGVVKAEAAEVTYTDPELTVMLRQVREVLPHATSQAVLKDLGKEMIWVSWFKFWINERLCCFVVVFVFLFCFVLFWGGGGKEIILVSWFRIWISERFCCIFCGFFGGGVGGGGGCLTSHQLLKCKGQLCVLPHWDSGCWLNMHSHPFALYWQWVSHWLDLDEGWSLHLLHSTWTLAVPLCHGGSYMRKKVCVCVCVCVCVSMCVCLCVCVCTPISLPLSPPLHLSLSVPLSLSLSLSYSATLWHRLVVCLLATWCLNCMQNVSQERLCIDRFMCCHTEITSCSSTSCLTQWSVLSFGQLVLALTP